MAQEHDSIALYASALGFTVGSRTVLVEGTTDVALFHPAAVWSARKGLEWELEDLLPPEFVDAFLSDSPDSVAHRTSMSDKVHRDLTRDGKARLHRFVTQYAVREDLGAVIEVLKALRYYMGLQL